MTSDNWRWSPCEPPPRHVLEAFSLATPLSTFCSTRTGPTDVFLVCSPGDRRSIVRRVPIRNGSVWAAGQSLVRETLEVAGIPLAPLVPLSGGKTFLVASDCVWQAYEYVEGDAADLSDIPVLHAAGKVLRAIHSVRGGEVPSGLRPVRPAVPPDGAGIADYMGRVEELIYASLGPSEARNARRITETFTRSLEHRIDVSELPSVLVHGEYSPSNLLIRSSSVVAVLDWDSAHRGPRIRDAVWSLLFWCRSKPRTFDISLSAANTFIPAAFETDFTAAEASAIPTVVTDLFTPSVELVERYANHGPQQLLWYLDWCQRGLASSKSVERAIERVGRRANE